jgi:hypothetical protein
MARLENWYEQLQLFCLATQRTVATGRNGEDSLAVGSGTTGSTRPTPVTEQAEVPVQ